nr:protein tyrosine phosphatase domain-containing protein 1-like [Procambarus clarkii]
MSVESVGGGEVEGLRPAGLSLHKREAVVHSNYSRLSEHLRQVTPTEVQCSVFCGGRRCRYDNYDTWSHHDMAIDGLYSHWVTDSILAMARPSTEVILSKDLVGQFLKNDIKTVINLQLAGEHHSCGEPLQASGFSYDPSVFMENGIFYYNFGLKDYGEPTQGGLLDMVKVMAFSLSEGKVAVHCHAGLGRTGVLIACYLVYALRVRANDAIRYVRLKRPNAVQTTNQIQVVQEFEQFILPQLYVFCNREFLKEKRNQEFTLQQYLHRQRTVLHGYEARTLKNIPKPGGYSVPCKDCGIMSLGLRCRHFIFNNGSKITERAWAYLPERSIDHLLDDGITDQPLTENSCYQELTSQSDLRHQADTENLKVLLPKEVYEALLVDHSLLDHDFKKQLKNYRIDLNVKQSAWERLNTETNLYILTGLMYTWLEHLRTPVLDVDALSYIVLASSKPEVCLRKLDKEVRYTLEYLIRFVSRLQPFSRAQQETVILRLIASVTQQAVPIRGSLLPAGKGYNKLREGTTRQVVEFMNKLFDLVYLETRAGSASSTADQFTNRVTPPGQVVTPPPADNAQDDDEGDNS